MSAFFVSFLVIFVAELGDKSQLVALWFATRYRWWLIILAVTAATLVVHFFSVMIGRTLDQVLPERVLLVAAGLSFLGFAAWSLRGDKLEDDATPQRAVPLFGAFGIVAASFFVSELGDKTQLATITLAGERPQVIGVWLGSTFGMVAADSLAIAVGVIAGKRLPQRGIAVGAALLFIVFGAYAIVGALA